MKQYKFQKIFLLLFILALEQSNLHAQDNTPVSRTIKVKKDVVCQIDFTNGFEAGFLLPQNSGEYYQIDKANANRSLQITTKQENLPPTTLVVTETSGKVWHISFEYKDDLDPDNEDETINVFSDNTPNSKKETITLSPTIEKGNKLKVQNETIPYNTPAELADLNKRYPGIAFYLDPPEQTKNLAETENDRVLNDSLYDKRPGWNLAFRSDMVKIEIVCQNLDFKGNNAYLKLLIKNDTEAEAEFLTGDMLLSVVRQNGSVLNLYPAYIFPNPFPVIKPGFQRSIIYSFKAYNIADEDHLKFEIHDRLQKIHLDFTIPGTEYNQVNKD